MLVQQERSDFTLKGTGSLFSVPLLSAGTMETCKGKKKAERKGGEEKDARLLAVTCS